MDNIPKVRDTVVKNDLCIGCGLCVYKCPSNALYMKYNEYGFLIPELSGPCDSNGDCLDVCPFNPFPKEKVKTENELAELFLNNTYSHHYRIGKYISIYAGYAYEFRLTSSSGGIATFIFAELLEQGIVDYIFSVRDSSKPGIHYEYAISSTKEDLLNASKTRYFPVTLATVLPKINELDGKVAIVGVACFIKAIRLAQYKDPILIEKIPFLIGIICGGIKSRFFTEYLAEKTGVELKNIQKPQFRIKDLSSTASDYSFGCIDRANNIENTIKMRSIGDMWGTGMFKANACDFCDDVTTELADISVGDAWLQPYITEGYGTNVIITRSGIADHIIQKGIKSKKLRTEILSLERFLTSQQGSFNHRHTGLSLRLKQVQKHNIPTPPKRFENEKVTLDFKIVQRLRMKVRQKSLEAWKDTPSAKIFDESMKRILTYLRIATRVYHNRSAISKKIVMKDRIEYFEVLRRGN